MLLTSKHIFRQILFLSVLLMISSYVSAQHVIKGQIRNEEGSVLPYTTVVLLQAKDSVMQQFALTGNDGRFELAKVGDGQYLLQLTFVGMETLYLPLDVSSDVSMGAIVMKKKTAKLPEVEVTGERTPVVVKEDTIEYNAEAFKTPPNANVEELLKKLPGVEVDRDGGIKAQGEDVTKVLVDGKEFFGDDPKIATKNLPADAVKKVQVIDRKSETAEFSGIDDGERIKTINLQLREGKKHGHFGTAEGGYGLPDNRYIGKFTLNRFSKNTQFSAIGLSNNINEQGFSMQDYVTFMGGFRNLMESGMVSFGSGGPSVSLGLDQNSGITTSHAGGMNFNADLGKKSDLYSSYFFNRVINQTTEDAQRSYYDQSNGFNTRTSNTQDIISDNHRLNLRYKYVIDTLQDIQLVSSVKYNDGRTTLGSVQNNFGARNDQGNSYTTDYNGDGSEIKTNNKLIWRKKFHKTGRFLTATGKADYNTSDRQMDLNSFTTPADSLMSFMADTVNQRQVSDATTLTYSGKISYTEPLKSGIYMEWHGVYGGTNAVNSKNFYDMDLNPEVADAALSDSYSKDYSYYRGGMNFKFNRSKYNLTVGAGVQNSILKGNSSNAKGVPINRQYISILPALHFTWRPATGRHMRLNYSASENAPTITQLQPVVDNSNPAQVYTGNPELLNELTHTLRGFFMHYNQFRFSSLFAHINANYTVNKIVNDVTTDTMLRQYLYPVNTDHEMSLSFSSGYSTPIRKLDIKINFGPGIYYSEGYQPVNGIKIPDQRINPSLDASVENRRKNHFDLLVGAKLSYNTTKFRDNLLPDQEYITQDYYSDLIIYAGDKWQLSSSFDYNVYGGKSFSKKEYLSLLKAGISRVMFKEDRGQLKFSVNDILDQSQGISRTSTLNYLEESHTNALGRYYMVSFLYSLNGFNNKKGGGMMMKLMGGRRR